MAPNVPDRSARKRVETGLAELRKWKRTLLCDLAHQTDPAKRAIIGHRIDDVERCIFLTEQLLHPMTDPTDQNGDQS